MMPLNVIQKLCRRGCLLLLILFCFCPWLQASQSCDKSLCAPYKLSICAIFQDEAPYLKEWIEFHRLAGVQHFYLYNNLSTDHYREVLAPYIKSGVVELIEWPYESKNVAEWDEIQCRAYNDALNKTKKTSTWLAILDTDEFLFSPAERNLASYLDQYDRKDIGGVCVNWVMFGTSNVAKIPEDKLLIESLYLSAGNVSDHFKSIVKPCRVSHCPNPHYCIYKQGFKHVGPDCQAVAPPTIFSVDKLRINHYWSRDEHFFYTQKLPRREKWGWNREICEAVVKDLNAAPDYSIFPFVKRLRKKMGLSHQFFCLIDRQQSSG